MTKDRIYFSPIKNYTTGVNPIFTNLFAANSRNYYTLILIESLPVLNTLE